MFRFPPGNRPGRNGRQRGAAAVEFALIAPLLLSLVLGVIDYGMAFSQTINLQGAAREAARQGVTQGDVIASANQASGALDNTKLKATFTVDTSAGTPGVVVVCLRYPQSSLSGFFAWALTGDFEAKAVMRMEGTAPVASGSQNWNGEACSA